MFVMVFTRECQPVLLTRYFCFVGAALLALLLFVGWYWPSTPAQPQDQEAGASSAIADSIRIRSAQRWPDKVVIDTSVPTIVPPPAPPAPILAQAQPAPVVKEKADPPAKHSVADAHAEMRRDPPAPRHKRQVKVARRHYQRLPPASSTWASAGPPMAPSWPWGW
jgi:hypothetical protein